MALSQTGLGTEGTNKPTYLTAGETYTDPKLNAVVFNWADLDKLGLRTTSTSTGDGKLVSTTFNVNHVPKPRP